jgi:flagellar biosynthesis protein FlhF
MRIGNVISCLARNRTPVAFLCDGQGVPQDLEEATVVRLLKNMEGFRIDREVLEKRFGRGMPPGAAGRMPPGAAGRMPPGAAGRMPPGAAGGT